MNSTDALKAFCDELASDRPSPGGGTASAAAAAMSASLLVMVCGVTARNKKYADRAETLLAIKTDLLSLQTRLVQDARLDAEAYDAVVMASRRRRESPGEETDSAYESALKTAAEVPMRTAEICANLLGTGVRVAELGSRSAWSDIGVALLLAEAAFNGAAMNVRINLEIIRDKAFVKAAEAKMHDMMDISRKGFLEATEKLQSGQR